MGLEVQVLVRMRLFSENGCCQGTISVVVDQSIQEGEFAVILYLKCEPDTRFNGVKVLMEALDVTGGKGCACVVHVPFPEAWRCRKGG